MKQIIDHLNVLTDPFLRDLFPSVHHFSKLPVPVDCLMQIYFVRVGLARIQSDRFVNVSNAGAEQMDRLGRINTRSKEGVRGHRWKIRPVAVQPFGC